MEIFKAYMKSLAREGLYILATSICTLVTYAFVSGILAPFDEHLVDKAYITIIMKIALNIVYIMIFSKFHVMWKYSARGRGDYEIIRSYKEQSFGGFFVETKGVLKRESRFVIICALVSMLSAIFPPIVFPLKGLFLISELTGRALGAVISFALMQIAYFLILYQYRRGVYKKFYVQV